MKLRVELDERQRAEALLRESEANLTALIENTTGNIWSVDSQYRLIMGNSAFRRNIRAVLGRDINKDESVLVDAFPPDLLQVWKSYYDRALRGEHFNVEVQTRFADPPGYMDYSFNPILSDDRQIVGVTIVGTDVTARRYAARNQTALYQISEAAHTAQDLVELFHLTHAIFSELMPAKNFYIALYDAGKNLLTFPYYVDEFDSAWAPSPPGRGMTSYILRTGKPLLATPETFQHLIDTGDIELIGTRAVDWLGVPLVAQNQVIGVLAVQTYTDAVRLTETHKDLLVYVSTQIATAIERKRAAEILRASEQDYRLLFHQTPIGVFHYDANLKITHCNDRFLAILQTTRERVIGLDMNQLSDPRPLPAIRGVLAGVDGTYEGPYYTTTSNVQVWVSFRAAPIYDEQNQVKGGIGTLEDISERKRAEDQIRAALREKEVLLKEVHHRVKNNLNVVSGLLELQAHLSADEHARQELTASQKRIRAMAILHEKLYQAPNLTEVNIAEYIHDLVDNLRVVFARDAAPTIDLQIAPVAFDLDTAITCGLIVNELVTNAFKYAFRDHVGENQIAIQLIHRDHHVALSIRDNGVGLPRDLDWRAAPSLGLQLVGMLSDQLDAEIELDTTAGSQWRINFALPTAPQTESP